MSVWDVDPDPDEQPEVEPEAEDRDPPVVWEGHDPVAEDLVGEMVDRFNARDLDGISELLSAEVEAEVVHAHGAADALDGLEDLFLREPTITLTRGEVGGEPMAGVWLVSEGRYVLAGHLLFELAEGDPPLVSRMQLVEELDSEDVLLEEPDPSEVAEWELEEDVEGDDGDGM